MEILTDFPGGNILVVEGNNNEFLLKPDLRDTGEDWFYWNFAVSGGKGEKGVFNFTSELVGAFGPAMRTHSGEWRFAPELEHSPRSFTYSFTEDTTVFFAFSLAYQYSDLEKWLNRNPQVRQSTLGFTKNGTKVPLLKIEGERAEYDIVFSCRHHCCESVASYMLEGAADYILRNRSGFKACNIHVLPFADIDGAERGDQGKSRIPHDHNRDYGDAPIYPEIEAWKKYVRSLNLLCGFDLHCPWKWGYEHDHPLIVHAGRDYTEILKFSDLLKAAADSGITYDAGHDLPFDKKWNTNAPTAAVFYAARGARLSFTFELPYFGKDTMYTVGLAREFGNNFAKALLMYISQNA